MEMNAPGAQVPRRLYDVRYREITDVIGRKITIAGIKTIAADVVSALGPAVRKCGPLQLQSKNMRGTLAKYKILDLRFISSHHVLSHQDGISRATLEDLSFLSQENGPATGDNDPTCLADLVEDTERGNEWVKVLLDIWPRRNALMEYMQALMKAQQDRLPNPSTSAFSKLMDEADQLFPSQFQIRDACITNSDFVWFHKHFYM